MKSLSLLKKIALGSGVLASITPIALMSTSCAIESIKADYIDFNSLLTHKDYTKADIGSQSFKRLLFGSKRVFNGNYILFTGSNMSPSTCKFYSGSTALRSRNNWFKTSTEAEAGHFWDGDFFLGIEKTAGTPIKNFGIFNVIDFWDGIVKDNKGHAITVCSQPDVPTQIISPFAKWTDAMITQTKLYNKSHQYDWDEDSVKANKDYIRNDSSAVAYRAFINTALKVYPVNDKRKKSFDNSDNNTSAKMLVFVDGELQVTDKEKNQDIWDIPTSKEAWYEMIVKYFKDEEKPKPQPEPPKPPEPTPPTPPKPTK